MASKFEKDVNQFVLKKDEEEVYSQVKNAAEMKRILASCPLDCLRFHLRDGGNDFMNWLVEQYSVKPTAKLKKITYDGQKPENTRKELVAIFAALLKKK